MRRHRAVEPRLHYRFLHPNCMTCFSLHTPIERAFLRRIFVNRGWRE
jgi:hypothetical protein